MFPVSCAHLHVHTNKKLCTHLHVHTKKKMHSCKMSVYTKRKCQCTKILKNCCHCVSNLEVLKQPTAYSKYLETKIDKSESDLK